MKSDEGIFSVCVCAHGGGGRRRKSLCIAHYKFTARCAGVAQRRRNRKKKTTREGEGSKMKMPRGRRGGGWVSDVSWKSAWTAMWKETYRYICVHTQCVSLRDSKNIYKISKFCNACDFFLNSNFLMQNPYNNIYFVYFQFTYIFILS